MVLPLFVEDDKHDKTRTRLFWAGKRYFATTGGRALLLCLIPAIASICSISRTGRYDVGAMAASETSRVTAASVFSPSILTLLWIAAALGWIVEMSRVGLVKNKVISARVPFLSLLVCTYIVQVIALFVALFNGMDQATVPSPVKEMAQDDLGIDTAKSRQMRGGGAGKGSAALPGEQPEALRDYYNADSRIVSETLGSWDELQGRAAFVQDDMLKMSPVEIVKAHEENCHKGVVSVILACFNEHQYMTKTLDSILNATVPGLIKEIVIVDDGSSPPMTTSFDTTLFKEPLIKVKKNQGREGLIRSKILGGNFASGNVIIFLDAHVKPDPGWVVPILKHINTNYKRVVVPLIPILNGTTWVTNRDAVGYKMMFEWNLDFHWFTDNTIWVPCMSGGLLAISKRWWHESGELDPGMFEWGGENIEQSLRIWMCGGEIVVAKDSVVAHVFRPSFPYAVNATKVLFNRMRLVEVWFDEYKEFYYKAAGTTLTLQLRPQPPLPYTGQGSIVDPSVELLEPFANISDRFELRERLKCKPFAWYVRKFEDVFVDRNLLPIDSFLIRNPSTNQCLSSSTDDKVKGVMLENCDAGDLRQRWTFRNNETAIQNIRKRHCLDAALSEMAKEWLDVHFSQTPDRGNLRPLQHYFLIYPCSPDNINQKSWKLENHRFTFGSFCVQADPPNHAETASPGVATPGAFLSSCKAADTSSAAGSAVRPWSVNPRQHFEVYAQKTLLPHELKDSPPS